ncbi:gapA, partial [Symbiodinium sp. CCMP2456]
ISEEGVKSVQAAWACAIKSISKTYLDGGDYVAAAAKAAGELYGYGNTDVLFKPTKAAEAPFRPTAADAMSYFVGHKAVRNGYAEDIDITGDVAIAMGTYFFTNATDGSKAKVEYTFGYKRNADGKLRICLHHSSVPFSLPPSSQLPEQEAKNAQAAWANATIHGKYDGTVEVDGDSLVIDGQKVALSHTRDPAEIPFGEHGDYVAAAAEAAGELYGYGHTDVLFKPTKAAEAPFRPTAAEAMSYFVGHEAVEKGYAEDAGFAINGGKGWSDVVFQNHQIDISSKVAVAMGAYYFTSAAVRIFLHHSSVPYSLPSAAPTAKISDQEVKSVQAAWANAIKSISKTYLDGGDYVASAAKAAGELYGYGHTNVLFKPTKAAEAPFRPTAADAMSYFVGHKANHKIDVSGDVAVAMGTYYFTSAADRSKTKVEYTFGYKRNADGKLRICLHHSSEDRVDFKARAGTKRQAYPVLPHCVPKATVRECRWALMCRASRLGDLTLKFFTVCVGVSATFRETWAKRSLEARAALRGGQGYGAILYQTIVGAEQLCHSLAMRQAATPGHLYCKSCVQVRAMQKYYVKQADGTITCHFGTVPGAGAPPAAVPVALAAVPRASVAADVKKAQAAWASAIKNAMSYFVGHSAVKVDVSGDVAVAMGNYFFTSAADGSKTKVEYTFGYKKNADGKEEVKNAQAAWANAIKSISKTYLDGGDYKAAAGKAAGELYGYGHSDVLFKPTK